MATSVKRIAGSARLEGPDRVAAILLTMGKSLAARLIKHFEPDEIRLVTRSVADLESVPAPQLEALIEDFATQFAQGANLVGTAGEVERMLSGVLPQEQIDEIMSDILGNADRSIWERVSSVNESLLAAYVAKEHPQTAALILSKIKSATAAKIIGHLPAHQRNSIIRRMLSIKPMLDDTMRMLERALHQEFTLNFARNSGADGNARVAEIINKLDRDQIDDVLKSLETTKPQAADALRGQLFTFEDLAKLSPKARTVLFDKVPNERVVLALKGTDQGFRDVILQALGSRVRRMVEQELANGQPATNREVTEARRSITNTALELAARGDIELGAEEEGYVS